MTTIVTPCVHCGHEKHPARTFELFRCWRQAGRDYYVFPCAACGEVTVRGASVEVAALLIAHKVKVTVYTLPDEITDPVRGCTQRMGMDDLLDFINALGAWDGELTA